MIFQRASKLPRGELSGSSIFTQEGKMQRNNEHIIKVIFWRWFIFLPLPPPKGDKLTHDMCAEDCKYKLSPFGGGRGRKFSNL